MPSRGLRGLWLRGFAAVAACLLALSSTGALVAAAVIAPAGSGPTVSLSDWQGSGGKGGSTDGNHGPRAPRTVAPALKLATPKPATSKPTPAPKPPKVTPAPKPLEHAKLAPPPHPAHPAAPAPAVPTARVVVDSSDPAPFSAEAVATAGAGRVLPVEKLGPLSGISFGSGLFIWPLLLAVDVLALAMIARMALRQRLPSPED